MAELKDITLFLAQQIEDLIVERDDLQRENTKLRRRLTDTLLKIETQGKEGSEYVKAGQVVS